MFRLWQCFLYKSDIFYDFANPASWILALYSNFRCPWSNMTSLHISTKWHFTGWSKETVDCNFSLTDPKFLKSAITQWFLESLYREVLVFWCFKSVRCVEFCLLELFQYRAFPAPYKARTLRYTLRRNETVHTSINRILIRFEKLLRHPLYISRQHKTPTDTSIRHSMSTRTATHPWTAFLGVWGSLLLSFGVCWSLLVSAVVLICPAWDIWRRCLKAYRWIYVCLWGLNASKGVSECSGHVWCRKYPVLEKLQKAKFHAPDTFETSKYQNLPILAL